MPVVVEPNWDEKLVRAWLREAADTLRRLPPARMRPRLTSWPEVVRDSAASLGPPPRAARPAAPSPRAIDRMETVLAWLMACDGEARRIVWARACGVPWRRLEDIDGRSHVTLRKVEDRGIRTIHRHLRAHPGQAPRPGAP